MAIMSCRDRPTATVLQLMALRLELNKKAKIRRDSIPSTPRQRLLTENPSFGTTSELLAETSFMIVVSKTVPAVSLKPGVCAKNVKENNIKRYSNQVLFFM